MSRPSRRALLRTFSLAATAALPGCTWLDDLFATDKVPLPGRRESVIASTRGMQPDPAFKTAVNLPTPVINADWPQSGGTPSHVMGNLSLGDLSHNWRRSIGEGGGYRRKITATPVIAGGRVYTMDSDGTVTAFDAATGARHWATDTQARHDRSTNVGGGIAVMGGRVYAATGRGEVMAIDAGSGKIGWRSPLGSPARSAPTVLEDRLVLPTLDARLISFALADGKQLWSYQATSAVTTALGEPAPAYADGTIVAGFGSGDLVALRSDSGSLVWSDTLASAGGRNSMTDLSAIRALPVITDGTVYAIGVGGVMLALDLRSGRRLWEHDVAGQYTPWIAGDWMFVLTMDQTLACLSRADGRVRWLSQLPRYTNEERSRGPIFWIGPVLGGRYLYCAGSTEKLIAINPATGETLGQQDLPDEVTASMVIAGNRLFVLTQDGTLSALG